METNRKTPMLTIDCDNESVRDLFYAKGILELGVTFSANGVATHHCHGGSDACTQSIDSFLSDNQRYFSS